MSFSERSIWMAAAFWRSRSWIKAAASSRAVLMLLSKTGMSMVRPFAMVGDVVILIVARRTDRHWGDARGEVSDASIG